MERLETQIARLEEKILTLDQKIDFSTSQNEQQHASVSRELDRLSSLIESTALRQSQEIRENKSEIDRNKEQILEHHDKINDFERDRKWLFGLFGAFWAVIIAWVQYKMTIK